MKEITTDVLIETGYEGVTLGAICTDQGVIMIDTPLSTKDAAAWRTTCSRAGKGADRLLVLLDEHSDRSAGASGIRCPIITHEKTAQLLTGRPSTPKFLDSGTGAFWETSEELPGSRGIQPEITFTTSMVINWGEEILLEHHPGPSLGAIWVIAAKRQVAFIGDTVTPGQPPFLANADIDAWLEALHQLAMARFRNFILISGRGELVTHEDIREAQKFLKKVAQRLDKLAAAKTKTAKVEQDGMDLAEEFEAKNRKELEIFRQRLGHGFAQYYTGHYAKSGE